MPRSGVTGLVQLNFYADPAAQKLLECWIEKRGFIREYLVGQSWWFGGVRE